MTHSWHPEYTEETINSIRLLTDECTMKYGEQFGRLLVELATRKYGKYILEKTSEQIYSEYGLIVAHELGCSQFHRSIKRGQGKSAMKDISQTLISLADGLRANPNQIPGVDGLSVAELLDSLYYCQNDNTIYHNEACSSKETKLILLLRKKGIAPEELMKRLKIDYDGGAV